MAGSNGVFAYSPAQAGTWSRRNVAAYGDLEVAGAEGAWTLGAAARLEDFEDFGTTANGKVSGRAGFVRGSVSTGFRAPTPGQQNGLHIQSWFDPTVGDLVNNAVIPSISPVARLRGGRPLGPEESVNSGRGEVFDPSGGLAQGFFDGRPIVDVELGVDLGRGATLSIGGQNVFDIYSQESVIANAVEELSNVVDRPLT